MSQLTDLTIALDWTPNTIHTGLFVAQQHFFKEEGLNVKLISPHLDLQGKTPQEKLCSQQVEFAIVPPESLIDTQVSKGKLPLRGVAALLTPNATALVVNKLNSDFSRPAQFKGRMYGAYGFPFEEELINQIIKSDGGDPFVKVAKSEHSLKTFDDFLNGKYDFTWAYLPWEYELAKGKQVPLNYFKICDFIPYVNSPIIATNSIFERDHADLIQKFLRATEKGYQFAAENPEKAAEILIKHGKHHSLDMKDIVVESQKIITPYYFGIKGKEKWGTMDATRWQEYVDFMKESNIITYGKPDAALDRLQSAEQICTNKYLPSFESAH